VNSGMFTSRSSLLFSPKRGGECFIHLAAGSHRSFGAGANRPGFSSPGSLVVTAPRKQCAEIIYLLMARLPSNSSGEVPSRWT